MLGLEQTPTALPNDQIHFAHYRAMRRVVSDADERAVLSRYRDPLDVVWLATARRLGLHIRRNEAIYSATDGTGLLELGPQHTLDADDCLAQMIFHEINHWITNGEATFRQRDWGFDLDAELDWREHSCLRLQAALAGVHGLRGVLAPTSGFRGYYDRIPTDVLAPLDDSAREREVVALAAESIARSAGRPWQPALDEALRATAALRDALRPFLADFAPDIEGDALPSLWSR